MEAQYRAREKQSGSPVQGRLVIRRGSPHQCRQKVSRILVLPPKSDGKRYASQDFLLRNASPFLWLLQYQPNMPLTAFQVELSQKPPPVQVPHYHDHNLKSQLRVTVLAKMNGWKVYIIYFHTVIFLPVSADTGYRKGYSWIFNIFTSQIDQRTENKKGNGCLEISHPPTPIIFFWRQQNTVGTEQPACLGCRWL